MELEQTSFPSFKRMDAEWGEGPQTEVRMLLVTQCPVEQEQGLAVWCLSITQHSKMDKENTPTLFNRHGRDTHMFFLPSTLVRAPQTTQICVTEDRLALF